MQWFADSSTVFLGASIDDPNNWTTLADDLSSNNEDLTAAATWAHDSTHVATDGLTADKTLEMVVQIDTSTSGTSRVLAKRGATTDEWSWSLDYVSGVGDNFRIQVGVGDPTVTTTVASVMPPSLSSSSQIYYVASSDEDNPDTTGPTDARLTTLRVWRIEGDQAVEYAEDSSAHAVPPAPLGQHFVVGAGSTGGAEDLEGNGGSLLLARVSDRPRSREEIEAYIPSVLQQVPGQGYNVRVKDDTVFAGGVGEASLTSADWSVDESQHATDLTDGTGYAHSSSERWEVGPPFSVEFLVNQGTGDVGYLYSHNAAANDRMALEVAGGNVEAKINDSTILTVALVERAVQAIGFSADDNPLSTAASDAILYTLCVFQTDGTCERADVLAAQHTYNLGTATGVIGADDSSGTSAYTGTIHRARVSEGRYHTPTETREDFIGASTPPTISGERRVQFPVIDRASGVGDQGEFVGPMWAMAAAAARDSNLRLVSPLVNKVFEAPPWIDNTYAPSQWSVAAPNPGTHTILGQYCWYAPLPKVVNWMRGRVHLQSNRLSGDDDIVSVRFRSMSRPPLATPELLGQGDGPITDYYDTQTVTANHGTATGDGVWLDFAVKLARDETLIDGTYLALSFDVIDAGGSGTLAAQRWRINAVVAETRLVPAGEDDLPFEFGD